MNPHTEEFHRKTFLKKSSFLRKKGVRVRVRVRVRFGLKNEVFGQPLVKKRKGNFFSYKGTLL